MTGRRRASFGFTSLALLLGTQLSLAESKPAEPAPAAPAPIPSAAAQLASAQIAAPGGSNTARSSDTGYAGAVNSSGGYGALVPLELPPARGGLPIPVQITYGERGVGAAGLGWDVPLSYIRRDTTIARRRPVAAPGAAPRAREQVSLVLDGQRMDLVRIATGSWVARQDAPALEVREESNGTWVMFDGQGRRYLFAAVSSALAGTGVWLLQDVSGPGGKVHLDYSITTPTISGSTALAIDLAGVSYNLHPATEGCYKHAVSLSYDPPASAPLSVSMVGTTVLARLHKLATVEVSSKASCGAAAVRLRRYQLNYGADPDTRLPRLQGVQMFGQDGTAEASTPVPIAEYGYGSATNGGMLVYQAATPSVIGDLRVTKSVPPSNPSVDNTTSSFTERSVIDISGDGRPDALSFVQGGGLSVTPNTSAAGGVSFAGSVASDGVSSADTLEMRNTRLDSQNGAHVTYETVWRQMIDVNGDGRVDLVDANERAGYWWCT